jgi:hypothetical protein
VTFQQLEFRIRVLKTKKNKTNKENSRSKKMTP